MKQTTFHFQRILISKMHRGKSNDFTKKLGSGFINPSVRPMKSKLKVYQYFGDNCRGSQNIKK